MSRMLILSPLDGRVIPLEEVPDEVFAEKVLGDGAAVIPENGNIYSPIDGEIVSIPESLHAYGIRSDAGVEMIVHFGLETVNLKGEGFSPKVKVGDRVKAGQLLCTADMDFLKSKGINTVTPVLVTDGAEEGSFSVKTGEIRHGEEIMTAEISVDAAAAADGDAQKADPSDAQPAGKAAAAAPSAKKKFPIDFDFLQKLGKSLMTVIAVMPAAGLMISLGNILTMCFPEGFGLMAGNTMAQIGWAIIGNLHILFAAAIGGSWAKEKAGGAFAAVIAFCLINVVTGAMLGVSSAMLKDPTAVTHTLLGKEILVKDYFVDILGRPALNMGVFVGIIAGFVGANAYNKYYNFRKLPDALSFFNGKRFVPLVVIFYSTVTAIILSVVWPVVQSGINDFGVWIANSSSTSPILAPFIYGTLERLLLPFGLHHMLTIPMNYTSFGGTYTILTGYRCLYDPPHHGDACPLQGWPDDRRHRPSSRHRPGDLPPGGAGAQGKVQVHDDLHCGRGLPDRCHGTSGVHVYVLRTAALRGVRSSPGLRVRLGRHYPPQASFLREPGVPDPRSHGAEGRACRGPGKLCDLRDRLLCDRLLCGVFHDWKVRLRYAGPSGKLHG